MISIHALRMERDSSCCRLRLPGHISIHALRMERDILHFDSLLSKVLFQSTRSAWSATYNVNEQWLRTGISIHALRMERDRG